MNTISDYTYRIIEDINREFEVDVTQAIEKGILDPYDAKKWLVKQLYYKWAKENRTYADIKYELSVKYEISVSSIEKMIYRK